MNRITILFILLFTFLTKGFSQEFSKVYNSENALKPFDLTAFKTFCESYSTKYSFI